MTTTLAIRSYCDADESAAIDLWCRSWQVAYPEIDFAARVDWWRARWRNELLPKASVVVAEADGALVGFVTVEPTTGYLDQIVVATDQQGNGVADMLLAEARRLSPNGLDLHVNKDNARAVRFYEKNGFVITGEDTNPRSGAPLHRMSWRPR